MSIGQQLPTGNWQEALAAQWLMELGPSSSALG
jgi:hypothetical protein